MSRRAWAVGRGVSVSSELVRQVLHAPRTAEIVGAAWDPERRAVRLLFESPDLPDMTPPEGGQYPEVDVTIQQLDIGYRWQWGATT